jgi:sulfite reductase (ferredoxin)
LTFAQEAFEDKKLMLYHAYAGFVNELKRCCCENEKTNHQAGIINLFDTVFIETNKIDYNRH